MGAARRVAAAEAVVPVAPLWLGETCVIIGGGPSLTPSDVEFCRGRARLIAVNDAYRLAPWADALYAHDAKWWKHHDGVPSFTGLRFGIQPDCAAYGVQLLGLGHQYGLSDDPTILNHGKNSGYQAIGLAVHLGVRKIRLLGFDMQASESGQKHWFGDHPKGVRDGMPFHEFVQAFKTIATPLNQRGIEVVNCSRRTALTMFPVMTLEEGLS